MSDDDCCNFRVKYRLLPWWQWLLPKSWDYRWSGDYIFLMLISVSHIISNFVRFLLVIVEDQLVRCRLYTFAAYFRKHSQIQQIKNITLVSLFWFLMSFLTHFRSWIRRYIYSVGDAKSPWSNLRAILQRILGNDRHSIIVLHVRLQHQDVRSGMSSASMPIDSIGWQVDSPVDFPFESRCSNVQFVITVGISHAIDSFIWTRLWWMGHPSCEANITPGDQLLGCRCRTQLELEWSQSQLGE